MRTYAYVHIFCMASELILWFSKK